MSNDKRPLTAAVVGCGNMARGHARVMAESDDYELVAACDVREQTARDFAEHFGGLAPYTDMDEMLATERPEVVAVVTAADTHAELTIRAAEAGVRAVCCEKPMATCMREARAMVEACRAAGSTLVINHQRRMGADFVAMRRLIEEGAIGDVYLLRGINAGDLLSDGTHTVDCIRWLMGDSEVRWVFGQIYREEPDPAEEKSAGYHVSGGWRYGHPIETGALAAFEFSSGVRAEILCGKLFMPQRAYQDHEVFGTKGRLWRRGDSADPPVLIQDEKAGGWRAAPLAPPGQEALPPRHAMAASYAAMARTVREGTPHPMSGDSALAGFEVLMAIYESARTGTRIELPLAQDEFPLRLMVADAWRAADA